MSFTSVNDELQELKKKIRAIGKEVVRIEKVGNGNMSAFQVFYRNPGDSTIHNTYFWRHDMDRFVASLNNQ